MSKPEVCQVVTSEACIDTHEQSETWRQRIRRRWKGILPVLACGTGLFSDGYLNGVAAPVNLMLGILYPSEYANSSARQNVNSIVFVGTVLGQLSFGWISDRWSRKHGMIIATVILIIFSILSAASYGANGSVYGMFAALTVYRFLLGIGIGGEYPAGSVACAEATAETPKGNRNFLFILFSNFCIDMGFVVSAFVPLVLLWIAGAERLTLIWRLSLGFGALPPLLIFFLRLKLKEPEQFEHNNMRDVKPPYKLIFRYYWKRLLPVSVIWFIYNFASYAYGIYGTEIINMIIPEQDIYKSLVWGLIFVLFYIPGSLFGALISDRLGPNRTLAVGMVSQSIIGFIMAACMPQLKTNVGAFTVVYGIFQSMGEFGPGNNIGLLASKTSATAIRGQYYGIAAAFGKVGAFVGTYVFPIIIKNAGGLSSVSGLRAPFWITSCLGLFASFIALFLVPTITQECIEEEDIKFRLYLEVSGWDTSQMGKRKDIEAADTTSLSSDTDTVVN